MTPLSEMGVRANAGTGATRELGDDSRARIRSQLREQLAPTYASMEKKYGLVWNADLPLCVNLIELQSCV